MEEMEYYIHNYVFIMVLSPETRNRVFGSLEWAFHIYIGSRSSILFL